MASAPPVYFVIPLKAPSQSSDPKVLITNLDNTLNSVFRSIDQNFKVILICQEHVDCAFRDDPRFIFLPANFPPEADPRAGDRDKYKKIRLAGVWLKEHETAGFYAMFLDADDLVDHNLVGHVRCGDNRAGYSIRNGYRFDCISGALALQAGTFHASCGSCYVGWFELDDLPSSFNDWTSHFSEFVRHSSREETAAKVGRMAEIVGFPAVTYLTNHAESTQMVRLGGRVRTLPQDAVIDAQRAEQILRESFGLELSSMSGHPE